MPVKRTLKGKERILELLIISYIIFQMLALVNVND